MGFKKPKKLSTFRLSEEILEQIKLMCEYDKISQADVIEIAINRIYVQNYHREMPDRFPPGKKEWLVP